MRLIFYMVGGSHHSVTINPELYKEILAALDDNPGWITFDLDKVLINLDNVTFIQRVDE